MEFLQELNESRMYRRLKQLEGKTINDIAERLFEHLLALQVLAYVKPSVASMFANKIMSQQQFDGFRTSMPDLFNLISLILKQEQYSHIYEPDSSIGLPELRLRRNLRAIGSKNFDNNDYSQMMLMLQRRFSPLPNQLITLRRHISNFSQLDPGKKRSVVTRLLLQMREKGQQSDFYQLLAKLNF